MTAVTKPPSGALNTDIQPPFLALTGDSSAVISPLTLPRGAAGYFDHTAIGASPAAQFVPAIHTSSLNGAAAMTSRGSRVYSPLSPGVRGPALQHPSFLSPHLWPVEQHRSSSLPPKTRNSMQLARGADNGLHARSQAPAVGGSPLIGASPMVDAAVSPVGLRSASYPPAGSAESAIVLRLVRQNRQIREAWEAERKYLEANRERAEEVYKEERALMEVERAEWEAEKALLLQEIGRLQQQLLAHGRNPQAGRNGCFSASPPLRGGGSSTSPSSLTSPPSLQVNRSAAAQRHASALPNGNSASLHSFPNTSSSMGPPSGETPTGPSKPISDFLASGTASSESEPGRTRLVDVHDIDPKLEGIPIKVTAITKSTFTDAPSHSPPKESSGSVTSPPGAKAQTLQVLAAAESDRLTMHAGHTPSHSLSQLPTGMITASSSDAGSSTPTMQQGDNAASGELSMPAERDHDDASNAVHGADSLAPLPDDSGDQPPGDHPEAVFEPGEDRKLRGPLMVRNVPAHDEIFFQKLSDKLEEVSKDDNAALPAVLKTAEHEGRSGSRERERAGAGPSDSQREETSDADETDPENNGSGSRSGADDDDEVPIDIPLRFKRPMNFGAPLGEMPHLYRLPTLRQQPTELFSS